MKRFEGKTVVVTGASKGIGRAIAGAFHQEGSKVVTLGLNKSDLPDAIFFEANFEKLTRASADGLVEQIIQKTGRFDVLVNNAGIIRRTNAEDYSQEDWQTVLQVNLNAPFYLCQAAAKWWIGLDEKKRGNGRLKIINIASMLSFQGGVRVPAYAASKSGIAGLTKALGCEWASRRMNVNAIAPGYIETDNTRALWEDPVRNKAILDRIPEGRWGDTSDIAGAAMFLASSDADYVNGAILNVDGGWLAR